MQNDTFPIGFWGAAKCGEFDPEQAAADWKELGLTVAQSFEYDPKKGLDYHRAATKQMLDAAHKQGIRLMVRDPRTLWTNYEEKGEKVFRKEVQAAVEDYAAHPAFYMLYVGDEAESKNWQAMIAAAKIVNELSNNKAFVNFLPIFVKDFTERVGVDPTRFGDLIEDAFRKTGLRVLSYDCYNQLYAHDREAGINDYFYNLNEFYRIAQKCGVPLWTCLICVGHWGYDTPTPEELNWQISTAVAHGCKGLLWFLVYRGKVSADWEEFEYSYRNSPFDADNRKTAMFDALSYQNRRFNERFAARLSDAKLLQVRHMVKTYGGTPEYRQGCVDGLILKKKHNEPMIVSEFSDQRGKFVLIVNNSQTKPEEIEGSYNGKPFWTWLAPGQMMLLG